MADAKHGLGDYVQRVMKLKGLTPKDVQRMSGERITGGSVASITTGRATNLSLEKLIALARGLGVDPDDLFRVACGQRLKVSPGGRKRPVSLKTLHTMMKTVNGPDVTQILQEVVRLSPEERADLLAFIKRLSLKRKKVRLLVEPNSQKPRLTYQEVMSSIRNRQRARDHHPRTREQVDAYLREERDSWGE